MTAHPATRSREPAPGLPARSGAGPVGPEGCAGARAGLDAVRFARLARDGSVDEAFAAAMLDPGELRWALAVRPSPVRLAAAVALKEAAVKCAGGRWPGFHWRSLRLTPELGDRAGTADTGVRADAADPTGPADRPGHRGTGQAGAPRRQAGSPAAASGSGPACGCAGRAEQILAGLAASSPRRALVLAPALSTCPASPAPAAEISAPAWTPAGDRAAWTAAGAPAAWTVAGEFVVALVIGVPVGMGAGR